MKPKVVPTICALVVALSLQGCPSDTQQNNSAKVDKTVIVPEPILPVSVVHVDMSNDASMYTQVGVVYSTPLEGKYQSMTFEINGSIFATEALAYLQLAAQTNAPITVYTTKKKSGWFALDSLNYNDNVVRPK